MDSRLPWAEKMSRTGRSRTMALLDLFPGTSPERVLVAEGTM